MVTGENQIEAKDCGALCVDSYEAVSTNQCGAILRPPHPRRLRYDVLDLIESRDLRTCDSPLQAGNGWLLLKQKRVNLNR